MKHIKIFFFLFLIIAGFSCTKLDETLRGELEQSTSGNVTADQLLISAYNALNGPYQTGDLWHSGKDNNPNYQWKG